MKEILFRGKRVDNGEWVYGWYAPLVCNDKTVIPSIKDSNGTTWRVEPGTVGQFTGLCDKNGKKIFEGDTVKLTMGLQGDKSTYDSVNCTVEFRLDKYCGIAEFYPFTSPNVIETEVIGNIYEPLSQRKGK